MTSSEDLRLFGNEEKYVLEVLRSEFRQCKGGGAGMMGRLESKFSETFNMPYAISHVNGTCTMHCLLEAIGIQPGDEVIVPPLTMASTTFVVMQANATPVFADVDPDTFQISPTSIRECVTEKTKAIITVSLFGLSPDMDPIMELANEKGIFVIEDNAEAYLAYYKGKLVGTIGHASSFSMQSSKHITAGEGGMVLTADPDIAVRVRRVNSLGYAGVGASKGKITKSDIQDPLYERHVCMGWNYRMPDLCAAVCLGQMEKLEHLVECRVRAAKLFYQSSKGCKWLVQQKIGEDYVHSYWTFVLKLDHPQMTFKDFRTKFMELGGDGIYAAWRLTYDEPFFKNLNFLGRENFISDENKAKYTKGCCPNAEHLQPRLLCFKTSYWSEANARKQANILADTIQFFNDTFE
jgi:perosamine synthetase